MDIQKENIHASAVVLLVKKKNNIPISKEIHDLSILINKNKKKFSLIDIKNLHYLCKERDVLNYLRYVVSMTKICVSN